MIDAQSKNICKWEYDFQDISNDQRAETQREMIVSWAADGWDLVTVAVNTARDWNGGVDRFWFRRPIAAEPDNAQSEVTPDKPATPKPNPLSGLAVGRAVHFSNFFNSHIAATVTDVHDAEEGIVDLFVMYPLSHDEHAERHCTFGRVKFCPTGEKSGTWHWPERVD